MVFQTWSESVSTADDDDDDDDDHDDWWCCDEDEAFIPSFFLLYFISLHCGEAGGVLAYGAE